MKYQSNTDIKNITILMLVATFMVLLTAGIDFVSPEFRLFDLYYYQKMAQAFPQLADGINQPFAFRLLGPALAGMLPFSTPTSFYILTVLAYYALVPIFYLFLRYVGLSGIASTSAVVVYLFSKYWAEQALWNYFQINDLLSNLYLVVLFWAMFTKRWLVFGTILVLGAISRETALLMLPTALFYLLERKHFAEHWRSFFISAIPAVVVFVALRLIVPFEGGLPLGEALFTYSQKLLHYESPLRLLVIAFSPFTFVPFVFWKETSRFFADKKYLLLFVFLVFVSALFGENDERLMMPAFVAYCWLLGRIVQDTDLKGWFLAVFFGCGFLGSLHHLYTAYQLIPSRNHTIIMTMFLLLLVTITTFVFKKSKQRKENTS